MIPRDIAREIVEGSAVLLKNDAHLLPLNPKKPVAFFGRAAYDMIISGSGSGAARGTEKDDLIACCKDEGICTEASVEQFYKDAFAALPPPEPFDFSKLGEMVTSGLMYEIFGTYQAPTEEFAVPSDVIEKSRENTDTAVLVIGRSSGGEECDRHLDGDYYCTDSEKALIDQVCSAYENVAVVLNVNGLIDLSWTKAYPSVKAVLFLGIPGETGGSALARILSGKVNPSGKMTVTVAENYDDYPAARDFSWDKPNPEKLLTYADYGLDAAENGSIGFEKSLVTVYKEDIYLGYRYFDSFNVKPLYPFGFGLSYTTFNVRFVGAEKKENGVLVSAEVKNTGDTAGKEVVQIYVSAGNTKSGRAHRELAGFEKTELLEPGEAQRVEILIPWRQLGCYVEAKAAYVIESGAYNLKLGTSSEDVKAVATVSVPEDILLEQCENRLQIKECNAGKIDFLHAENAAMVETETTITLLSGDVKPVVKAEYKVDIEPALKDFTTEELAALCVGYGPGIPFAALMNVELPNTASDENGKPLTTNSHPTGVNGYVSPAITEKGIESVYYKDGPAGVGLVAWPTEMLIGCCFDRKLARKFGDAVASECEPGQIDLWLAPAVNLHRHPLGGRNFEYYSEDPFLSGAYAVEVAKGAQENHPVLVCAKHFAVNEQETYRRGSLKKKFDAVDSVASERAIRELYLRPFEMLVKEGDMHCIMSSFNKINGTFAGGNKDLCTHILREEWGFDGAVVTDWGDMDYVVDGADAVAAGNDIVMPGGPPVIEQILKGFAEGRVTREELETAVSNLLSMLKRFNRYNRI
ncbi:MAG: glycoside hydrolase family 3 protein [Clostridia bacterium]|nr:glycoside hydrolase family 3 protein [Clostridia bacterium]